jgi:hypothetical protein
MSEMSRNELVLDAVSGRTPNREGWIRANCPICDVRGRGEDRSYSLALNVRSSIYVCWRCEVKGKLYGELDEWLHAPAVLDEPEEPPAIELPEGYTPVGELEGSMVAASALQYLLSRVPRELAIRLEMGACFSGYWAGRIIVPIKDQDRLVGFLGRDWTDRQIPRYLYPRGMSRDVMFNRSALELETDQPVALVEGVFDAFPHLPDVVACLGKPTPAHVDRLLAAKRPVAVILDGDAWTEAQSLAMQLQHCGGAAGWVRLPPCTDPAEIGRARLQELALECIGGMAIG